MFGKQNPTKAWRSERIAMSACLRSLQSLPECGYTRRLGASHEPSPGGPPV